MPKPVTNRPTKVQLHIKISYDLSSVIPSKFILFTSVFDHHTYKSYNYNCTIHLLQLQMTFYNCRHFGQLHIKICPARRIMEHRGVNTANQGDARCGGQREPQHENIKKNWITPET